MNVCRVKSKDRAATLNAAKPSAIPSGVASVGARLTWARDPANEQIGMCIYADAQSGGSSLDAVANVPQQLIDALRVPPPVVDGTENQIHYLLFFTPPRDA